jgi:hypothetical protein
MHSTLCLAAPPQVTAALLSRGDPTYRRSAMATPNHSLATALPEGAMHQKSWKTFCFYSLIFRPVTTMVQDRYGERRYDSIPFAADDNRHSPAF